MAIIEKCTKWEFVNVLRVYWIVLALSRQKWNALYLRWDSSVLGMIKNKVGWIQKFLFMNPFYFLVKNIAGLLCQKTNWRLWNKNLKIENIWSKLLCWCYMNYFCTPIVLLGTIYLMRWKLTKFKWDAKFLWP